jgi:hypothetical protein
VIVSRDGRDVTPELAGLTAIVLRGLVRCTGYAEDRFRPEHVDNIVHALRRCGVWTRPGAVGEFRAWHREQRRKRDTYMATARALQRRWWTYYCDRHRHGHQYRALRRRLVVAIAEVKALAASVVYFGDAFAAGRGKGRTIAARFLAYYLLQALRGADERNGKKPRIGLGASYSPAIDVLREWLTTIMEEPPSLENLTRMLKPDRAR